MAKTPTLERFPDRAPLGRAYKLAPNSLGMDSGLSAAVDLAAMSATTIISTPTPDRIRDSMVAKGCQLDNYRKNPVIFWEHGFDFSLPIAKSEDPSGNLSVAVSDANVVATAYFTNKLRESEQIFALVADKIIRGASVRFTPKVFTFVREGDDEVCLISEWELEEWSYVGIPCNPEAVAGVLAKNHLAGSQIAESIAKSLKLWLPESAAQSQGWSPPENLMTKPTTKNSGAAPADDPNKPAGSTAKNDPPADETPVDDTPADEVETEGADKPLGAQVLSATHSAIASLIDQCESAMGPLENPAVKESLAACLDGMKEQLLAVEGAYASAYPDAEPLKAEPTDGAEQEAAMKAFLASGSSPRLQLAGIGARLKTLEAAKGMDAANRKSIREVAVRLQGMLAKAKAYAATGDNDQKAKNAAVEKRLDELEALFGDTQKQIDDVRPHRAVA